MQGLSVDDVLGLKDNDEVFTTIVTLQNNGLASYSVGQLLFHRGSREVLGSHDIPRLKGALDLYRSDQTALRQPFDAAQKVQMGVTVSLAPSLKVRINDIETIVLETRDRLLVGTGRFVDPGAVYVIAFPNAATPPH
jgi:hypothetical protein